MCLGWFGHFWPLFQKTLTNHLWNEMFCHSDCVTPQAISVLCSYQNKASQFYSHSICRVFTKLFIFLSSACSGANQVTLASSSGHGLKLLGSFIGVFLWKRFWVTNSTMSLLIVLLVYKEYKWNWYRNEFVLLIYKWNNYNISKLT